MGKISRNRKKYHTSAKTTGQPAKGDESQGPESGLQNITSKGFQAEEGVVDRAWNPELPVDYSFPSDLFSGVKISGEDLNQQLDTRSVADDTRSLVSKKSFKSDKPYNKKEKRQLRHEAFMMKLNAARDAELEAKARRKREKTLVVGDMKPLADALPQISAPVVKPPRPVKARSTPKSKTRHKMMLADIAWMTEAIKKTKEQAL